MFAILSLLGLALLGQRIVACLQCNFPNEIYFSWKPFFVVAVGFIFIGFFFKTHFMACNQASKWLKVGRSEKKIARKIKWFLLKHIPGYHMSLNFFCVYSRNRNKSYYFLYRGPDMPLYSSDISYLFKISACLKTCPLQ